MSNREFLQVDPATLHLPGGRRDGVDPMKLHRQMARRGMVADGERPAMTTEDTRAELLEALAELGHAHPHWRLGQALSNLAMAAGRLDAGGVWDLEDDEALAAARRLLGSRVEGAAVGAFQGTSADDLP
jgi:hypothetical protein